MSDKFKVGDRVICLRPFHSRYLEIGKVSDVYADESLTVNFGNHYLPFDTSNGLELHSLKITCHQCSKDNNPGVSVCWNCASVLSC